MTKLEAKAILKSVNRWAKKERPFDGGRSFGIDFPTWFACYPQVANTFRKAAEVFTGRECQFAMPIFR